MPLWNVTPISLGGVPLSNADRTAYFLRGMGAHDIPQVEPVLAERLGDVPVFVRIQPGPKVYVVEFILEKQLQSVVDDIRELVRPRDEMVTLVVDDGEGIAKQAEVVCQGHRYVDGKWAAPLLLPDPRMVSTTPRTASLTTPLDANFPTNPVNLGDADALPILTILPTEQHTALDGYKRLREVTYGWRSELPATSPGSGTYLLNLVEPWWNTSAIVKVSGITTTSTTTFSSSQSVPFNLTVTSTASFDPSGGICMLSPGASEEQCLYTITNATTLRIFARSVGGTTAQQHNQPFTVQQSRMMKDGRDIVVFEDEVILPRERVRVAAPNTTATKIWVETSDAVVAEELLETVVAGTSNNAFFRFRRDHIFRQGDYLAWRNSSGTICQGFVVSIAADGICNISKDSRNAPAMQTTDAGTLMYKANHHYQVAWNYAELVARPADPEPPVIDLVNSSNDMHILGSAPWWNSGGSARAGGVKRLLYSGGISADLSVNQAAQHQGLDVSGSSARFTDSEPTGDKPNFDALEYVAPCGITNISFDATLTWPWILQVLVRDMLGGERLLAKYLGHETGTTHEPGTDSSMTYADENIVPSAVLSAVILRARNSVVTNIESAITDEELETAFTVGQDIQQFQLDAPTRIRGVMARVKKGGAGTKTLELAICEMNGDTPGDILWSHTGTVVTGTGYRVVCAFGAVSPVLPAGSYGLFIYESAGTGAIQVSRNGEVIYPRGRHVELTNVGGAIAWRPAANVLWFALLSDEVDNQAEVLRTNQTLLCSDLQFTFDPNRVPLIDPRPEEDAVFIQSTWKLDGVEQIRIEYLKRWAAIDIVTIDTAARTVVDSALEESVRQVVTLLNPPEWMAIPPGTHSVGVILPSFAQVADITYDLEWRDTWQTG